MICSFWFVSQSNSAEQQLKISEASVPEHFPNEWMFNQRAYPDGHINQKAVNKAWSQLKSERKSGNPKSVGTWESEGPLNIGGRVTDIAISPVDDNTFYIGTPVGGVFRTTDRGESWESIFDAAGRPSIGSIAIAPSDPNRIYVGTGEGNGSATSGMFFGDGAYRSDDGGDSWASIGLPASNHFGRIIVDPQNADRVFAATTGVLYGSSSTRGLYRTLDGGDSWDHVLYVSDSTACIDVVMHPTNTDTLYAATWERRRRPWVRDYGGVTSGVHRSVDGGETWEVLTNGLPESDEDTGRIGLAISASEPNVVYASYTTNSITNVYDGLYRSEDHGVTWNLFEYDAISNVNASFGWYFGNVRVNPEDPDEVLVLGQLLYHTGNGGDSWSQVGQMHVDFHSLEYSTLNNEMMLCGNDGGLYISENGGTEWTHFENLPITQFYQIEVDEQQPERVYGGTQDNNTLRTLTGSLDDFESILGGDGFHVNVDPTDNDYVYAEYQWGNLFRSNNGGSNMTYAISDIPSSDRTNWNTPVILSPFNPAVLYYGSNRLYRSDNHGVSWEPISDDLTQGPHESGSTSFGTLISIAASASSDDVVYTGSDDGTVSVTFNGGDSWTDISAGLPDRYVTGLAIHPEDNMTAYVTLSGFGYLDYDPHVFKTTNGGSNWVAISDGLPSIPVNDILIQPEPFRIFIATDMAVQFSEDDGETWDFLGDNLPPTIMTHLQYHEATNRIYIGTFGRSIYSFGLEQIDFVGVEGSEFETHFSIYPNPSSDYIVLYGTEPFDAVTAWAIVDMNGAEVLNGTLSSGTKEERIDTRSLRSGNYLIRMGGLASAGKFQVVE